ncbi:MAG: glutaminase A [Gammaproteobacteria bacterium]|nr:glutaminase A [Gammaproteobacteria bacterium]
MKTYTSLHDYLEQLRKSIAPLDTGQVADYIPELAKADPDRFGIAVVTVDGHVYQSGDARLPFSIQSISKAFTYGIALEDKGHEEVARRINVEPSGEAFNSISLEPETGRPLNPMINSGAIVATSLVDGENGDAKLQRILEKFALFAGRPLEVHQDIYESERTTGHRNRAIAHLLRTYDILEDDPEPVLDAYFRQCSILVTTRDLAVMGATLANDGVNPITGVRALEAKRVSSVLSVMATCGMYDYSGNWIHRVGMPAKSGVGGGLLAVLPGQLAVAVFSPRLDAKGNSVRGIATCEALSSEFGLHMLRVTRVTTASVVRASYTGATVRSKINRDETSNELLDEAGHQVQVIELTGELRFVSAEIVTATVVERMQGCDYLILDMERVTSIDQSALALLTELVATLAAEKKLILLTGTENHYTFRRRMKHRFHNHENPPNLAFADVDRALEYAEDRLLGTARADNQNGATLSLQEHLLCRNFDTQELALLAGLLEEARYDAGEMICEEGTPADELYFLASGRVSASVRLDHNRRRRLSAFAAGWTFGESALFAGAKRSADIHADTPVLVHRLDPARLRKLDDPNAMRVALKLFRNLAELSLSRLGHVNREIRNLSN